jgi:hypothetical protein
MKTAAFAVAIFVSASIWMPRAFAHEEGADVVSTLLRANEKVRMSSCTCEAAPYQTPSLERSDANMCNVIKELSKGDPKKFDTKNPYGLCAPIWKSPVPGWTRPEAQKALQVYGTSDFQPLPRNEYMRLKGFSVLREQGRAALIKQTDDIREGSAKACCGTDSDCLSAMRGVRVSVCSSPADQDPSQPDPCEAVGGSYNLTTKENAVMALTMKDSVTLFSTGLPSQTSKVIEEARALLGGTSMLLEAYPATGEIVLSPYVTSRGEPISEMGTLRHEFGHACSFIKRQIAAKPGKSRARENAMSFFMRRGTSCELDPDVHKAAYGSLLKETGASRDVEACLLDLARQSTVETSSAYIPNSCQLNKIEEATAEAFAFYTLPIMPDSFPDRACSRLPSTKHPASVDVFTCVIKADARKRREFAGKYRCEGVR